MTGEKTPVERAAGLVVAEVLDNVADQLAAALEDGDGFTRAILAPGVLASVQTIRDRARSIREENE
jgi:hypothetical protein